MIYYHADQVRITFERRKKLLVEETVFVCSCQLIFIDLLNLSASNNHFIASNYNYYINVIDAIKNKL